jgi:MFS family permease
MRFRTDGMRTLEGKAAFRLLFGCLLTVGMGNSMLLAVLPALSRTLGLPDAAVGVIFSFSAVLWVITSPLWGRASDRLGRKRLIVFGLAAYAASQAAFVAVILLGLAGHWEAGVLVVALMLARALFGAGGSATSPAAQAWVAERTEPAARMSEIAALTSAFAFGSAAGPAIAAILVATVGLTAPLILAGVTAAAGAVAAQRLLAPDAPAADAPRPEGGPAWALAREPHVLRYLIFAVLLSAVTAMTSQTLAFTVIDRLDLSPARGAELTAVAFAAAALAQIVAQIGLIPRLSLTPRMLMTVGAGVDLRRDRGGADPDGAGRRAGAAGLHGGRLAGSPGRSPGRGRGARGLGERGRFHHRAGAGDRALPDHRPPRTLDAGDRGARRHDGHGLHQPHPARTAGHGGAGTGGRFVRALGGTKARWPLDGREAAPSHGN